MVTSSAFVLDVMDVKHMERVEGGEEKRFMS